jgi:hypothetical protein
VDAFAAQMADRTTEPITLAFALIDLYRLAESALHRPTGPARTQAAGELGERHPQLVGHCRRTTPSVV